VTQAKQREEDAERAEARLSEQARVWQEEMARRAKELEQERRLEVSGLKEQEMELEASIRRLQMALDNAQQEMHDKEGRAAVQERMLSGMLADAREREQEQALESQELRRRLAEAEEHAAALQVELGVASKDAQGMVVELTFDQDFAEVRGKEREFAAQVADDLQDAWQLPDSRRSVPSLEPGGAVRVMSLRQGSVIATILLSPYEFPPGTSRREAVEALLAQAQDGAGVAIGRRAAASQDQSPMTQWEKLTSVRVKSAEDCEEEKESLRLALAAAREELETRQEEVSRLEEDRSRLHRLLESLSEDARSTQAQAVTQALEHEEALAQQMAWVRERERDMKQHLSEALDEQQRLRDLVGERERDAQQRLSEAVEEQQRLCGVIAEGDRAREAGQAEVESLKARQSASEQVLEEVCGRMAAAVAVLEQDLVELQTSLVAIFQDLKEQERSMEEEWEARLSSSVGAKEREKQAAAEELSSYVDMLSSSLVVAAAEFEVQAHSASAEAAALDRLDGVVCAILESLGVTYAALEHRATAQAQHAAAAASQESARSSADMAFGRHLQAIDDSVGLLEERLRLAADVGLEQAQMLNDGRHSRDGMLEEVTRSWLEASEALEHVHGEAERVQREMGGELRAIWQQIKQLHATLEPVEQMVLDEKARAAIVSASVQCAGTAHSGNECVTESVAESGACPVCVGEELSREMSPADTEAEAASATAVDATASAVTRLASISSGGSPARSESREDPEASSSPFQPRHEQGTTRFGCEYDCGYEGGFEEVAEHEKICSLNPTAQGGGGGGGGDGGEVDSASQAAQGSLLSDAGSSSWVSRVSEAEVSMHEHRDLRGQVDWAEAAAEVARARATMLEQEVRMLL